VLKENVKDMLTASKKDTVEHIEFINQLCRLGVSYHFDDEIENSLKEIFDDIPDLPKRIHCITSISSIETAWIQNALW
jgi:hypothetical protein